MEVIRPKGAVDSGEPFSAGMAVGNLIFLAGQIGIDANGNIPQDIRVQARQAFVNIKTLLEEAGSSMHKMVKNTMYLTNFDDLDAVNEVYLEFVKPPYAANTVMEINKLWGGAKLEIEVIAKR